MVPDRFPSVRRRLSLLAVECFDSAHVLGAVRGARRLQQVREGECTRVIGTVLVVERTGRGATGKAGVMRTGCSAGARCVLGL